MPPPMKSKTKCFRTDGLKVIILPLFQKSHLQKHSFFFRILVLVQLILPRQMVTPREGPSHALATAGASFYPLDLPDICRALEGQGQRSSTPACSLEAMILQGPGYLHLSVSLEKQMAFWEGSLKVPSIPGPFFL